MGTEDVGLVPKQLDVSEGPPPAQGKLLSTKPAGRPATNIVGPPWSWRPGFHLLVAGHMALLGQLPNWGTQTCRCKGSLILILLDYITCQTETWTMPYPLCVKAALPSHEGII